MLQAIDDDLWVAESDFKMGAIEFGGRMSVIRLEDGSLLLYSPIEIDDALAKAVASLGEVRHLVAPSGFHYLFMPAAQKRWPNATSYGPPAATKKGLTLDVVLGDHTPEAWRASVDTLMVAGAPDIDEVILHHRPSKTLVLADLVFNLHDARGWLTPLFFRMLGVWGKLKQSPLWRFALTKDREAAQASLRPMWAWDFERIVLCHGHIVEGADAKARLAHGMRWMCRGHEQRQLAAHAS